MSDEANYPEPNLPPGESVRGHPDVKTDHVSERISLSFLIIVTVLISVIALGLWAIGSTHEIYIAIVLLLTLTALSQVFTGKRPGIAFTIAGVMSFVPWYIIVVVRNDQMNHPEIILCVLPTATAISGFVGYVAGVFSSGEFPPEHRKGTTPTMSPSVFPFRT